MHNHFPARGSEEWYAAIEQLLAEHATDVKRLWDRVPQSPDNIGESPNNPDWDQFTSGESG